MAIGTVQEFGRSQKGSSKVKINGAWYFVGKCNTDGMQVGQIIDFESNVFGDRGNLHGLQTWKLAAPVAPQGAPQRANGQGAPMPAFDGDMLRYASNVVANAIQAGLIKTPRDITPWFWAAMDCPKASDEEPPFNDELP